MVLSDLHSLVFIFQVSCYVFDLLACTVKVRVVLLGFEQGEEEWTVARGVGRVHQQVKLVNSLRSAHWPRVRWQALWNLQGVCSSSGLFDCLARAIHVGALQPHSNIPTHEPWL